MANIENNNQYKVGDKVWWFDSWDNLRWGIIYEIVNNHALIHENGKTGIQTGAALVKCWPTKEECLEAERRKDAAQKAEYIEGIKDVKDLVQFLFDHDTTGEFRDYAAIDAAKERAKDLLGFEIKD